MADLIAGPEVAEGEAAGVAGEVAHAVHDGAGVGAATVVFLVLGQCAGGELVGAEALAEDFAGDGHAVDGAGEARVAGKLYEDLFNLGAGEAVVEAAVDVAAELVELIQRGEHGDDDEAAVTTGEAGTGPDVAEGEVDDVGAESSQAGFRRRGGVSAVDGATAEGGEDVVSGCASFGMGASWH